VRCARVWITAADSHWVDGPAGERAGAGMTGGPDLLEGGRGEVLFHTG
jgi:hypothetical protein